MPKYGQQTQWRERHAAISKKCLDSDMLHESEYILPNLGKTPMIDPQTSPTSIFSTPLPSLMPEMQPIVLPGAWVTVGKKGKPLKETKMYIDPPKMKAKKKKRSRKLRPDDIELLEAVKKSTLSSSGPAQGWGLLEEAPSVSACLNEHARSCLQKEKQSHGGKAIKYWVKFHREKEIAAIARDELCARIDDDGIIIDEVAHVPHPKLRDDKARGRRAAARSRVRHESQAARCYWPDADDVFAFETASLDHTAAAPSAPCREPTKKLIILPGAWVTVGKKGKPLQVTKPRTKKRRPKSADGMPVHALLEEAPSVSACLNEHARSCLQKEKQSHGGKAIKYWVKRRHEKEMAAIARDELCARIREDGIIADADERATVNKQRNNTKTTRWRALARRHARQESTAARCYWPDMANSDDHLAFDAPHTKMATCNSPRGASKSTLHGSMGTGATLATTHEVSDEWSEPSPVSEKAVARSPPKSRGHEKKKAKVAAEANGKSCTVM